MTVLAVAVPAKKPLHGLGYDVDIRGGDELVQQMTDLGFGTQTTRDVNLESLYSTADPSNETNIIELRVSAIGFRVRERDLQLARE